MKNSINSRAARIGVVGSMVFASVLGFAAMAGATTYDPTTVLTGLASTATSTASPILIAVIVALIPLMIVFLVIGWVRGMFGRRKH
jgi:hypothetical protein